MMKKAAVYLLAVISVLAMAGCAGSASGSGDISQSQAASAPIQMPNPWQGAADMQEAEKIAGFRLDAPERVKGYSQALIQVMKSEEQPIIEVQYGDEGEVTIRKAPGEGDISGAYGEYTEKTLLAGKTEVSVKSTQEVCVLANWCEDGYTYAVYIPEGMSEQEMTALVAEIQ